MSTDYSTSYSKITKYIYIEYIGRDSFLPSCGKARCVWLSTWSRPAVPPRSWQPACSLFARVCIQGCGPKIHPVRTGYGCPEQGQLQQTCRNLCCLNNSLRWHSLGPVSWAAYSMQASCKCHHASILQICLVGCSIRLPNLIRHAPIIR